VYVLAVAPGMLAQLDPEESHRLHWWEKAIGVDPFHVPVVEARVCPSLAVPETVGLDTFCGGRACTTLGGTG
jgi:hypothetical protein